MKHPQMFCGLIAIMCVEILATAAMAAAPQLISYQGRATDVSGSPVTDGLHSVQFQIYNQYNILRWTEAASVTTSGGRFSHNLGSVVALNPSLFSWNDSLFLQVTFEGQVQSPRTLFTTSPYAFHVNSIDGSEGGIINGYISIHSDYAGDEVVGLAVESGNGIVWAKEIDGHKWIALDAGEPSIVVQDDDANNRITLDAGQPSIVLQDDDANNRITLDAGQPSIVLQDDNTGVTASISPYKVGIGTAAADTAKMSVKSTVAPLAGTYHTGIDSRIKATNSNGRNHGGYFRAEGGYEAIGIQCRALNGSSYGAAGEFISDDVGIYVVGNRFAALISGNVGMTGNLVVFGSVSKSGGSFKIDHPLDPENKYLQHSFVESPDMMNVYNGNVITDNNGYADVAMPDYFEALNMGFRYQLTVIGEFAQAIISKKINNGRFTIRTDKPNIEVSWQVTGIRRDRWANEYRIEVEVDKPAAEQGYFISPELYGYGKEKQIDHKLNGYDKGQ